MRALPEVISSFEADRQAAEDHLKSLRESAQTELQDAQHQIVTGGASTGNALHDGLLAVYGKDLLQTPKIIANYERTTGEMQGKTDEPVLLVHSWTRNEGCTGFGGRAYKVGETAVVLGILAGTEFVFDYSKEACAIPTVTYARTETSRSFGSSDQSPEVHEGNIQVSRGGLMFSILAREFDLGRDLDEDLSTEPGSHHAHDLSFGIRDSKILTVHVGRTAISEWATNDARSIGLESTLQPLCEALEIESFDGSPAPQ